MSDQAQIAAILTANGFHLARKRKHAVWKDAGGRVWTVPSTPSDKKALVNNLADLKNFLRRGKVQGAFGLKAIDESERADFERTLHPVTEPKRKEVKERNVGISIERFKQPKPVIVFAKRAVAGTRQDNRTDGYAIGSTLCRSFMHLLRQFCDRPTPTEIEQDYRQWAATELRKHPELNERDILLLVEEEWAYREAQIRQANERAATRLSRTISRIFQKAVREKSKGVEIQESIVNTLRHFGVSPEEWVPSLALLLFDTAMCSLGLARPEGGALSDLPPSAWDERIGNGIHAEDTYVTLHFPEEEVAAA